MSRYGVEFIGVDKLANKLKKKSETDFEQVYKANARAIYARSQATGGTPVDSNELRRSASVEGATMGYRAQHAPHVEYGHRTVNGGFVPGQFFLRRNVNTQRPIFKQDLIKKLKE